MAQPGQAYDASGASGADMPPNERQREFINFMEGAALLHAPVGTGKTRSLADRASAAIQRRVPADRILCLTFTNRAARELRERVRRHCGDNGKHIVVRTFHSLCAWLLRQEHERAGLPADFVIYDEEDAAELLGELLRRRRGGAPAGGGASGKAFYNRLQDVKARLATQRLDLKRLPEQVAEGFAGGDRELVLAYERELLAQRAVDFDNLVLYVRALFDESDEVRQRWSRKFYMLQVDEMQDTNLAEYYVVRVLARGHRNIVLAGDFDQTIYEWRGSRPATILDLFEKDFGPVRKFEFVENYRATQTLINAAASVVRVYSRHQPAEASKQAPKGEPIVIHFAASAEAEAKWIARKIEQLRHEAAAAGGALPYDRVGVLVRANYRAQDMSRVFERAGLPHVTVEQFDFFRRQEIKDAIALLRFALNPADAFSFRRTLRRPPQGIGDATLAAVEEAHEHGLRLVDMVSPPTRRFGEPFAHILEAYERGAVTIFDTETTGKTPGYDEIVELAALRLEGGRVAGSFRKFLRNTVPVGDSEQIHGWSDEYLREHGEDPARVLAEFADFAAGSVLVGHNVNFDISMVQGQAERLGVRVPMDSWADTWEMARRFVRADNYSLEKLVETLGLSAGRAHHASYDVQATCELLQHLMPAVRRGAAARREAVARFRHQFEPVARRMDALRAQVGVQRPHGVLQFALQLSGLEDYYADDRRRTANLQQLLRVFERKDNPELSPRAALEMLVQSAALMRNVDLLEPDEGGVRLLTAHQSKGLEFDVVFVAGLNEYEFPSSRAIQAGDVNEELRVFYVALTRAKRRLFLTGHLLGPWGRRTPSRFLQYIGPDWREEGSSAMRWPAG